MIKSLENINMRSIWAFSAIVTVLLIATAAKQIYGEEPNTIDEVISEGLEQCSHIKTAHCFGVWNIFQPVSANLGLHTLTN
jgi:hypothetical protein